MILGGVFSYKRPQMTPQDPPQSPHHGPTPQGQRGGGLNVGMGGVSHQVTFNEGLREHLKRGGGGLLRGGSFAYGTPKTTQQRA